MRISDWSSDVCSSDLILAVDRDGVLHTGRGNMDPDKQRYARDTDKRTLAEIVDGVDIFLGLSAGGVLKPEMLASMAPRPIILAPIGRASGRERGGQYV